MYKINEAAEKFNVNPNVLRFYEKKHLINPVRDNNGYRMYTVEDMLKLQTILLYRKMGFSLENIAIMLKDDKKPIELFFKQYNQINHHIHSMTLINQSLEKCINLMFEEDKYSEDLFSCMKNTAGIITQMESWEDKWGFDDWALEYDNDIKKPHRGLDFYRNYDKVMEVTADKVNEKTGIIAEIGVGTGNLAGRLIKTQNVIGIDQSINMLILAKNKYPNLKLRIGTFLELPLHEASVDTVVCSYAFHHCNENERKLAFKEMDRVLKPKGRIIITDLMFYSSIERRKFEKSCTNEEYTDLQDEFFTTVENMEADLQSIGYSCTYEQIDELIWIIVSEINESKQ